MHLSALNRRKFLLGTATTASGLLLPSPLRGSATSSKDSCALDTELTQGPYYLDRGILRRDVTEGKPGLPLRLRLTILDARSCIPVHNAALEIWHCDARGIYSGYTKMNPNGSPGMRHPPGTPGGPPPEFGPGGRPPGPPPDVDRGDGAAGFGPGFGASKPTDNTTFCRGLQLSDARGVVEFETIYPGWYMGRDTHIHLKVHDGGDIQGKQYAGGHVSHTGQLFFPDELSDQVAELKPYAERREVARTKLDEDMVFEDAHGAGVILGFEPVKSNALEAGLIAKAVVRIDPNATPRGDHGPGRRPPAV